MLPEWPSVCAVIEEMMYTRDAVDGGVKVHAVRAWEAFLVLAIPPILL